MALQVMRTLGADLLDFVFPPQCLACGDALEENKESVSHLYYVESNKSGGGRWTLHPRYWTA